MVTHGFSLFDTRKLYLDELYDYYQELFYILEKQGKVKEQTYDKIISSRGGDESVKATVNMLRKQMFNSIANKNRPK